MENKILPLLLCLASAASARSNDNVVDQPTGVNDSISLNEVVVTGQGAQIQRRRLSSTFVKVQAKDLSPVTSGRLDVALQDALPAVQFSVTTSQPGATSIIRSRGLSSAFANSTPVIYVDGVRMDNTNTDIYAAASHHGYSAEPYSTSDLPMGQTAATGSIGDIPLDNIDHIEYVPGGAATTLYGSDAANGVIQIFTRKGGDGRFHAFFSTQFGLDEANSQYYYFKRTKDLLNQTGLEQVYRLGFDGGNERFGYSFGASMGQNTGTLIHNGNDSKRYSMRFGSRVKINKILDYDNSFGFLMQDFRRTRNGNQGLYTGLWTTECSAANDLRYTAADGTVKNLNADIDAMDDEEYGIFKTFVSDAERLQYNRTNIKRFQTAHTLTLTPFKGFSVKGIFGLDYRRSTNKEITTNEWLILTQVKPEGTSDAGRVFNTDRDYLGITADINARHSLYLGNWLSNIATVGFQYFNTHDKQTMLNGTNVRDGVKVMSGAGTITGDEYLSYLHSYGCYLQDNIGFLNRYYIDLGLRTDYNSAFGDNTGWQWYPKAGLSYIISDEDFMAPLRQSGIVSSLRLRANAGIAGNFPPAFAWQRTINIAAYQGKQAATFGEYGNPDLGPEKMHSYEGGFEASLFHNKLNIGFTYYYTRTLDAIFSIPTLPSSGQSSTYLANVGEIRNHGMEWTLGINAIDTRDWTLTFNASANTNHNRVASTGGQVTFRIGGFDPATIMNAVTEGKPIGYLYGNKAVLNSDGSLKEVLTDQDLGSTLPTFYGNFSIKARYRNLRLNIAGDYQTGAYVHSFDAQFRFRKGITDTRIPAKALEGLSQKSAWLYFTNYFVSKADFLKIRNIGLDYTFSLPFLPIKKINAAFNVYNPLAFTASHWDPEATLSGALSQGGVSTGGINYATFSAPRQYILTLTFDF